MTDGDALSPSAVEGVSLAEGNRLADVSGMN